MAADVGPVQSFCVQTLNAYGPAYAGDKWFRFPLISDYLAQNPCELVALQEVWSEDQYNTIRRGPQREWPEMRGYYFGRSTQSSQQPRFGMATLTSQRVTHTKRKIFRVNFERQKIIDATLDSVRESLDVVKGYGTVVVQMHGLFPVAFINTHLHPTSEVVRLAQMIELLEEVELHLNQDIPVVLSGDLNTQPGSLELDVLRQVGGATDTLEWSSECTYCFWNPYAIKLAFKSVRMDYTLLFSSKSWELKSINAEITPKRHRTTLSDHYGVRSEVRIERRTGSPEGEGVEQIRVARAVLNEAITKLMPLNAEPEYRSVIASARSYLARMRQHDDNDEWVNRLRR